MTSPSPGPTSLTDLIALSEEMAALVKCGVPLDRGLLNLGRDMPGQLGRTAQRLAKRLQQGEDMATALAAESAAFPPVYQIVVKAGLKSGRLPAALERLAASARRLSDLRSMLQLAMLYPLLVFLLAYGLFVLFTVRIAPELQAAYASLEIANYPLLDGLVWMGISAAWWGPMGLIVVLLLGIVWWWQSGRAMLISYTHASRWLGWIPWTGKLIAASRGAMVTEIFALLLEHSVPLDEALLLAAEASGDSRTIEANGLIAQAIRQGQPLAQHASSLPPMLAWMLTARPQQAALVSAARHAAEGYAWQAAYQAEKARLLFPVLATLFVAGLVTMFYALMLYVPWSHLLRTLA